MKSIMDRLAKRNKKNWVLIGMGMSPSLLAKMSGDLNTDIVDYQNMEA